MWTVILFLGDLGKDAFAALYMVPLSYLIGVPILLGIFKLVVGLFRLVDLAGFADLAFALVSVMGALGIMVGDPILFLLQKVKPGLLPVEKFHFVNFCMIYFVTCE